MNGLDSHTCLAWNAASEHLNLSDPGSPGYPTRLRTVTRWAARISYKIWKAPGIQLRGAGRMSWGRETHLFPFLVIPNSPPSRSVQRDGNVVYLHPAPPMDALPGAAMPPGLRGRGRKGPRRASGQTERRAGSSSPLSQQSGGEETRDRRARHHTCPRPLSLQARTERGRC